MNKIVPVLIIKCKEDSVIHNKFLPLAGVEPAARGFRSHCSTTELQRHVFKLF